MQKTELILSQPHWELPDQRSPIKIPWAHVLRFSLAGISCVAALCGGIHLGANIRLLLNW